jgi:hypothetical protein
MSQLRPRTLVGTLILVSLLAACTAQPKEPVGTGGLTSHGNEVGGYVELIDALRATGAQVQVADQELEQPFFTPQAQVIRIEGYDGEVQVFEYADDAARQAESSQISPDGSSIGTTMVTWVDQPHFWAKGRLIVLYVGSDAEMEALLTGLLGEPIAR